MKKKEKENYENRELTEVDPDVKEEQIPENTPKEDEEGNNEVQVEDDAEAEADVVAVDESAEEKEAVDEAVVEASEEASDEASSEAVEEAVEEAVDESDIDCLRRWRESDPQQRSALKMLRELSETHGAGGVVLRDSLSILEGYREGAHEKPENLEMALAKLLDVAAEASEGIISPESIEIFLKAAGYDSAVEAARAEGEICGRNAIIEERIMAPKGKRVEDVPRLGGTAVSSEAAKPGSIFDLASYAR